MELAYHSRRELLGVVTGTAPLVERAIALRYLLGIDARRSQSLVPRRGEPQWTFDRLAEAGFPVNVIALARESYRKTGEPLGPAGRPAVAGARLEDRPTAG